MSIKDTINSMSQEQKREAMIYCLNALPADVAVKAIMSTLDEHGLDVLAGRLNGTEPKNARICC